MRCDQKMRAEFRELRTYVVVVTIEPEGLIIALAPWAAVRVR